MPPTGKKLNSLKKKKKKQTFDTTRVVPFCAGEIRDYPNICRILFGIGTAAKDIVDNDPLRLIQFLDILPERRKSVTGPEAESALNHSLTSQFYISIPFIYINEYICMQLYIYFY